MSSRPSLQQSQKSKQATSAPQTHDLYSILYLQCEPRQDMDECGMLELVSDAEPGPAQRRRGKSLMSLFWVRFCDLTQKPLCRDVLI